MFATKPIFQPYQDSDGSPLEAGYLYFGTENLNPETNPITVYWDEAGTQPAAQPIRTLAGFPSRNGAIAQVFTSGNYSLTVRNRNSLLVYSAPTSATSIGAAILAYIQAGANAVWQTVQNALRKRISVFDYGAVGDGVTDDYAAFAAAEVYAGSIGGAKIVVPRGYTYKLGTGVTITHDNVEFVIESGAIVKAAAALNAVLFHFNGVSGGGISGLGTIDCNRTAGVTICIGIQTSHASYINIRDVTVKGSFFSNIKLLQSDHCKVRDVTSYDAVSGTSTAYGIVAYGTTHCSFTGNHIHDCDAFGIGIVADSDPGPYNIPALYNIINGNIIHDCTAGGINVDNGVNYFSVNDNIIHDCGNADTTFAAGVLVQGGTGTGNGTVNNNTIYNIDGFGITSTGAGGVIANGNRILLCSFHGIYPVDCADWNVVGNSVFDCSSTAVIWAGGRADAIRLLNCFRLSCTGNTVGDRRGVQVTGYGINEAGTSDVNNITGNTFSAGLVTGSWKRASTNATVVLEENLRNFKVGSFQINAGAASVVVNDAAVQTNSFVFCFPLQTVSSLIAGSSKCLFSSAIVNGVSFTMSTGDGTNVANNAIFGYVIIN